jgi:5-formyltetrahydrofolate cyclo-ligase
MEMNKRKSELRREIGMLKLQYGERRDDMSTVILAKLEQHPLFLKATTVALYSPLPDEIDTNHFIDHWSKKKHLLLPAVVDYEIKLRPYNADTLVTGIYGVRQPMGKDFTNFDKIDLVVVPGVAFDRKGNRLGRGKGMYDRMLQQIKAYKIGLCFPYQLVDEVPVEPHDVPVDEVLTIG